MKKIIALVFLLPLLAFSQGRVQGGMLWNFYSYTADTVAYTSGDVTVKYQIAPKFSDYTNYWASDYTNVSAYDSLCVIDSLVVDSLTHYVNVPTLNSNYAHSSYVKYFLMTGSDTLASDPVYIGELRGALTLYFRLDKNANGNIQAWGYLQGN
jgi:hypothetical protein